MKLNHFTLWVVSCFLLFACDKAPQVSTDMSETFYLQNNGADMPVFVRGNGESKVFVLLLHGGPGDGGLKYRGHTYSDLLEKEYAMVYWDQRHQGNSHGHMSKEDITIDMMVEDTYALVKVLKERYGDDISLFLMGHSWGGLLGTSFMIKEDYQNEINGWIESGGAHDFPFMNQEIIKRFKEIAPVEIAAENHTKEWNEVLEFVNGIDTSAISTEEITLLNEYAGKCENLIKNLNAKSQSELSELELYFLGADNPFTTTNNQLFLPESFYQEIVSTSLTNELHKITTPTLLCWGRYDFKVPYQLGQSALEKISTSDKFLKIYENAGHSSMRYEPEQFAADVIEFIEMYKN